MEQLPAPWTGESLVVAEAPRPVQVRALRMRRWSLQIGGTAISWSNVTEQLGSPAVIGGTNERRPAFGLALAAVAGGLALVLAGATAGRAWSPAVVPTEAAMLVPAATPLAPAKARPALARKTHRAPTPATPALDPVPAAPDALSRTEAIARAVRTGEFQEWTDRDGVSGFAVPGVAEVGAGGACRTLAVLARRPDGTDQVSSSKVCSPVTPQD